jgi:hypothetical protein
MITYTANLWNPDEMVDMVFCFFSWEESSPGAA